MTKDFTTKDFTAIRTRLEEGTANWSDVSNWVHPDRVDVGGGAVRIMQGNYGLRFKIDGSWDDLSRNTSGRWFVVCEASLFRWGTEEDRRRPKMHVHPDRVFDVPYLWGLKGRLKDHALHVSALYRSIVDECVALHPEGGRLIGQAEPGRKGRSVSHSLVMDARVRLGRSRPGETGRYGRLPRWSREAVHAGRVPPEPMVGALSHHREPDPASHCAVASPTLLRRANKGCPRPAARRHRRLYLVVSFGPPHPPGAGDTHPWFELNFDPEKGPVHGW